MNPQFSEQDSDLRLLKWRITKDGYARTQVRGADGKQRTVLAHHMVLERSQGRKPDWNQREVCDHIDRNKLNNERSNLRIASMSENMRNRPRKEGVRHTTKLTSGKFQSQVCINRKSVYLGCFDTEQEANAAAVEFLRKEAA